MCKALKILLPARLACAEQASKQARGAYHFTPIFVPSREFWASLAEKEAEKKSGNG
jgi:hypothetical protein